MRSWRRSWRRREVNRQTLKQYILDETEDVRGARSRADGRCTGTKRDFTWYVRDGDARAQPASVQRRDRRRGSARPQYETQLDRSASAQRQERKRAKKEREESERPHRPRRRRRSRGTPDAHRAPLRLRSVLHGLQVRAGQLLPRRAGTARREGRRSGSSTTRPPVQRRGRQREGRRERSTRSRPSPTRQERARSSSTSRTSIAKMNKTALVTLWVDPTEHQIVKYTFDNVWLDFLPGAWLVRIDDLRASMTMGQPFPGVWLPRGMNIHAGLTLAIGSFEAGYERDLLRSTARRTSSRRLKVPKEQRGPTILPDRRRHERAHSSSTAHGPVSSRGGAARRKRFARSACTATRSLSDEDVLKLAGIARRRHRWARGDRRRSRNG